MRGARESAVKEEEGQGQSQRTGVLQSFSPQSKGTAMPGSVLQRREGGVTLKRLSNRYSPSNADVIIIEAAMYEYGSVSMKGDHGGRQKSIRCSRAGPTLAL